MTKKLRIPLVIILTIVSLAILLIFVWALLFSAYYTAFLSFLGLLVFLPVKIINRHLLIRACILIIGIVLLIATVNISIGEINKRIKSLSEKPGDKSSLSAFSTRDKIGIYGLNVMMGALAYPVYPEVSKETLMLVFPAPKTGIRVFYSDFALHSEKMKDIIRRFIADLDNRQPGKQEFMFQKRIHWETRDYSPGKREARYALALNPSYISLRASRNPSGWFIDGSIKVKVSYPQNACVTLLSEPELKVEEGLFRVLQEEGWLFPYTAEWKFTINTADDGVL